MEPNHSPAHGCVVPGSFLAYSSGVGLAGVFARQHAKVLLEHAAEGHRHGRKAVKHRRLQAGVTGGRDAGTQIVADNEEHIGPPRRFGGGRAQASERPEDDEQSVGELLFCSNRCFERELIRRWFQLIAVSDDPRTLHRDPIIKLRFARRTFTQGVGRCITTNISVATSQVSLRLSFMLIQPAMHAADVRAEVAPAKIIGHQIHDVEFGGRGGGLAEQNPKQGAK